MMNAGENLKPKLKKVAVFGSNGRIGRRVAEYIANKSPETELRLIIRSESSRNALRSSFPGTEVVVADYYDMDSLIRALDGVEGVFLVTPNRLDEECAMRNFVFAARRNPGQIKHIVRLMGDPPGMSMDKVPDSLRNAPGGTAVQHLVARDILSKSRLPITYVNVAAYFMQNFSGPLFALGLIKHRTLVCPRNRRMAYIDAGDIGKCCGAILLSDDHRHIGTSYNLDNGHDVLRFDEVAALMTEVWGEPVRYDGSDESFVNLKFMGDIATPVDPPLVKEDYFVTYSQFEQDNQNAWRKTDIVEYLSGEKAVTLAEWLKENKETVFESTEVPRQY